MAAISSPKAIRYRAGEAFPLAIGFELDQKAYSLPG
jgi:hypothetical protein